MMTRTKTATTNLRTTSLRSSENPTNSPERAS
jgi:hypothetical protein